MRTFCTLFFILFALSGCAMQRAAEAETAQENMIGMSKEDVFACMGIPKKKATVGKTEIWLYKSTDGWSSKSTKTVKSSFSGAMKDALSLSNEHRQRRYCKISIVMRKNRVRSINYNGPTGGFMTEDEQCAYAVRNCLR